MVWSIFDGIDHVIASAQPLLPTSFVVETLNFTEAADYIEFVVKVAIVEIYNERLPVMDFHGHVSHVHVKSYPCVL